MKPKHVFCASEIPMNKRRWLLYKLMHIIDRANVPEKYLNARVNDFDTGITDQLTFDSTFITGGVGVGKTHLMVAMLKWECEKKLLSREAIDLDFVYVTVPELFLQIKNTYSGGYGSEKELIDRYTGVDKLFLDDLGTARPTEWSLEILYMIIDGLYKNNKSLVLSSNHSLKELQAKYDQRIISRVKEMCGVLKLSGQDKRPNMKKGR